YEQRIKIVKASVEANQGSKLDDKKDQKLLQQIKDQAFNDLVTQSLIRQDAEKQGVKVSTDEIDNSLKQIKSAYSQQDSEGYNKFLKSMGLNEKELSEVLKNELLYQKMQDKVSAGISVSDADVKQYYEKNKSSYVEAGGIEIYHILVKTEKEANEIIAKLKNGGDFAQLAKQYSLDSSKDNGGDLGIVNANTNFVPEFKNAALKLKPGEITTTPVKSQFGYHIIKAGEKKAAYQKGYEEVQSEIKAQLEKDQKDTAFNKYLSSLRSKAKIKDLRKK
ncbi:MAG TPA: peptidylprolyl isomerase, partial [Methanobacterium sp.]|nr:peptidylprolyl isomerase [Methanobacterium sp.]